MSNKLSAPIFVSADYPPAMRYLFPDAPAGAWVFEDHGDEKGLRLAFWNLESPIPTESEVAALVPDLARESVKTKRFESYRAKTDALAIRAQRLEWLGDPEAEQAKVDYLAAVAAIKAEFPYSG